MTVPRGHVNICPEQVVIQKGQSLSQSDGTDHHTFLLQILISSTLRPGMYFLKRFPGTIERDRSETRPLQPSPTGYHRDALGR